MVLQAVPKFVCGGGGGGGGIDFNLPVVSQLDKCLKFKSILGTKMTVPYTKSTPRNAINFRNLSSCGTIIIFLMTSYESYQ